MTVAVLLVAAIVVSGTITALVLDLRGSAGGPAAPLSANATTSDAFDGWTLAETDPAARFLATDTARAGRSALLVRRAGAAPVLDPSVLSQQVAVTPGRIATLRFVATSAVAPAGAVVIRFGLDAPSTLALPEGPFEWRSFALSFDTPVDVDRANISIVAAADTSGVTLDSFGVREGSAAVAVDDGGFERNSADLRVTDGSLILQQGSARLQLASRRARNGSVEWSVETTDGRTARSGTAVIARHRGAVALTSLPAGYYRLRLRGTLGGRAIDRSVMMGIVDGAAPTGLARFGLGVPIGGETGDRLAQKVDAAAVLGVGAIRTSVNWGNFEPERGRYQPAGDVANAVSAFQRAGVQVLLVAHYGSPFYDDGTTPSSSVGIAAYAAFAAAVAAAYPDTALDVENEPNASTNTSRCGRTPECYLRLLGPAAASVRAASPTTVLSAPGLAGGGVDLAWMRGFIDGGGLRSTDVVSIHPYSRPAPPDELAGQLAALRQLLDTAASGSAHPIWITEFGDPTVPRGLSEARQAEDLVQATVTGLARGAERFYWYDEVDHTPIAADPESNYGLFRMPSSLAPDAFEPKPAALAEAVLTRRIGDLPATGYDATVSGLRVVTYGTGPATVRVAWSTIGDVRLEVTGPAIAVTDSLGTVIPLPADRVLTIGADPVYIQGNTVVPGS